MSSDEDGRIAYLAGENAGSLPAHERASLDELRAMLATHAVWEEPPPGLEDTIVAAIEQDARARAVATTGAPARRRRRSRWPGPALALAGVASAALAVIAIVLGIRGGGPGPERFAMIVSGTPLAPRAHGSATLTKTASGWRIQLTAVGLPHLTGGRYYEAWLKNRGGVLVPVGTFNDARQVTLWAGVPATQFPTLTVTIQRVGGNPTTSGLQVLIGAIRR